MENTSKCKTIACETRSEEQAWPQESTLNGEFVTEDKRTLGLVLAVHERS